MGLQALTFNRRPLSLPLLAFAGDLASLAAVLTGLCQHRDFWRNAWPG